ncbi:type II toxin-antitoxin system RelE/ParE family toxin [Desulfurivibrio sp. D14AmB]|uniref:type II toxin-antitoxin system RelE family toxin n=1 Tax=Desulfurivibrio sp. D14AmB TaxID=3374370 RepID=UPI00376EA542
MNRIEWSTKAYRQLRKLRNPQAAEAIFDAVGSLASWPDCKDVKHLTNHEYQYRLRVGRYRVFFDVGEKTITIITVQEVKKRDERTY